MSEILLIGNPNVGKSTLFNTLTKSNGHTGNWHGVTVDFTKKNYEYLGKNYEIVDLPGLYSLSPNSYEEQVSINYILSHPSAKILLICSNATLKRNLFLFYELSALKREVILVVNSIKKDINFDKNLLSKNLGVSVVNVNAKNGKSVEKLKEIISNNNFINKNNFILFDDKINIIKSKINNTNYSQNMLDFFCYKVLCGCEYYFDKLNINKFDVNIDNNYMEYSIKNIYKNIDEVLNFCKYKNSKVMGKSALDKFVLNKYLSLPIFLAIVTIIFYLTFFSVGAKFSEILRLLIQEKLGNIVVFWLEKLSCKEWLISLVQTGIFGGVGTVLSFLPQVVLLFLFLGILEDSGYLSRLAFMFDDTLKIVGLSGRSIYTLIMGFGCSTTACLTCRNMSDKNAKTKTAMLAPFMSCSAKLPVYAVVGGAFFGASNILTIILLYFVGIIIALLLSLFFENTSLKSNKQTFLMEFPDYQVVGIKRLIKIMFESAKTFLTKIGTLLISLSVIVWILENYSFTFSYCKLSNQTSMLQAIGEFISPIFLPLGFKSWGAVSALISGVVAKEMIISSIAIFNNVSTKSSNFMQSVSKSITVLGNSVYFTPGSALSFMVFCLLYVPCISTISVLRKEIGRKWTIILIFTQFILAYITSCIVYFLYNLFVKLSVLFAILISLMIVLFIVFVIVILKKNKKVKISCVNCFGCK